MQRKQEKKKTVKRRANGMDVIITRLQLNGIFKVESAYREGRYLKEALRPRQVRVRLENEKQK